MMERCRQIFSYVVDHDYGFAPNPDDGLCSLARCKYGTPEKANLVEKAMIEDLIIGTVGKNNTKYCSGIRAGGLLYMMKVTEKITLKEYVRRYPNRQDAKFQGGCDKEALQGRFALLSDTYLYFGRKAISLDDLPQFKDHPIAKTGPGYRKDFDEPYVRQLEKWMLSQNPIGKIGAPLPLKIIFVTANWSVNNEKIQRLAAFYSDSAICMLFSQLGKCISARN